MERKFKKLLEEFQKTLEDEKKDQESDIDLRIAQTMRELRQMIERLRRLKDNEQMIYEPVGEQPPVI